MPSYFAAHHQKPKTHLKRCSPKLQTNIMSTQLPKYSVLGRIAKIMRSSTAPYVSDALSVRGQNSYRNGGTNSKTNGPSNSAGKVQNRQTDTSKYLCPNVNVVKYFITDSATSIRKMHESARTKILKIRSTKSYEDACGKNTQAGKQALTVKIDKKTPHVQKYDLDKINSTKCAE